MAEEESPARTQCSEVRCISCYQPADRLYRQTDVQCIILTQCGSCGRVVDPYVECEFSVVLLNLLLLDTCAFRHILYNSRFAKSYEMVLKVLVCELLSEGYFRWSVRGAPTFPYLPYPTLPSVIATTMPSFAHASPEMIFYSMCASAVAELVLYGAIIHLYCSWKKRLSVVATVRCVVLGVCSSVLHVPATVWGVSQHPVYRVYAVAYRIMAATQALKGSVQCQSTTEAASVVTAAMLATELLSAVATTALFDTSVPSGHTW